MAFLRTVSSKIFPKNQLRPPGPLPEGVLEIAPSIYMFSHCVSPDAFEGADFTVQMRVVLEELTGSSSNAAFKILNFGSSNNNKEADYIHSTYKTTMHNYPHRYEGCPLLPLETICNILTSSENWLSSSKQNLLLLHCELGGWAVLAFIMAALLLSLNYNSDARESLDMIYRKASREHVDIFFPLDHTPSQLRYLCYILRKNEYSEWPPDDKLKILEYVLVDTVPNADMQDGCSLLFKIYGRDPYMPMNSNSILLFANPEHTAPSYKKADEPVRVDIHCHVQGDVVLECINLKKSDRQQTVFRVVFNTAFLESNVLMLNRDDIDVPWDSKEQLPENFRAEVHFVETEDPSTSNSGVFTNDDYEGGLSMVDFMNSEQSFIQKWPGTEDEVFHTPKEQQRILQGNLVTLSGPNVGKSDKKETITKYISTFPPPLPPPPANPSLAPFKPSQKVPSEGTFSLSYPTLNEVLAGVPQPAQSSNDPQPSFSNAPPPDMSVTPMTSPKGPKKGATSPSYSSLNKVEAIVPQQFSPVQSKSSNVQKVPPPPPPKPKGATSQLKSAGKSQPSLARATSLKPLHWVKVSRALQGTLWAEAQKADEASRSLQFDMTELESLFSVLPNPEEKTSSQRKSFEAKPNSVCLIDLQRSKNCEIMLRKISMPFHELVSSVLALDCSKFEADQIDNLIKFCPTKDEVALLQGYHGDKNKLGICEQFFCEMMTVPRMESKLRVLSFKIRFSSQVTGLKADLYIVKSVAEEVMNSVKLRRVMQTILSLGNALNQGTNRGSAVGFRLDSLLKLSDIRARNKKTTVMHYLCKVIADKTPEIINFDEGIVNIENASKIRLQYLTEEMQEITGGVENAKKELRLSESDGVISRTFVEELKQFLADAEADILLLDRLFKDAKRNAEDLLKYFGEDPARCSFEQVLATLMSFIKMFKLAHDENIQQLKQERSRKAP